jgi:hypothetical protein
MVSISQGVAVALDDAIAYLSAENGELQIADEFALDGCCYHMAVYDTNSIVATGRNQRLYLIHLELGELTLTESYDLEHMAVDIASTNAAIVVLDSDRVGHFLLIRDGQLVEMETRLFPGRSGRIAAAFSRVAYWGGQHLILLDLRDPTSTRVLLDLNDDNLDPQYAAITENGVVLVRNHEILYARIDAIGEWSTAATHRSIGAAAVFATDARIIVVDPAGLVVDYTVTGSPPVTLDRGELLYQIPLRWWEAVLAGDSMVALTWYGAIHHLDHMRGGMWAEISSKPMAGGLLPVGADIDRVGDYIIVAAGDLLVGDDTTLDFERVYGANAYRVETDGSARGVVLEFDGLAYRSSAVAFDVDSLPNFRETGRVSIPGLPADVAFCNDRVLVATMESIGPEQDAGRMYAYDASSLKLSRVINLPDIPQGITCVAGGVVMALGESGVWRVDLEDGRLGEVANLVDSDWAYDVVHIGNELLLIADKSGIVIMQLTAGGTAIATGVIATPSQVEHLSISELDGQLHVIATTENGLQIIGREVVGQWRLNSSYCFAGMVGDSKVRVACE